MSKEDCVAKLIGGDVELANFILGQSDIAGKSDREASRLLLAEVDGMPGHHTNGNGSQGVGSVIVDSDDYNYWGGNAQSGYSSQDWGGASICPRTVVVST